MGKHSGPENHQAEKDYVNAGREGFENADAYKNLIAGAEPQMTQPLTTKAYNKVREAPTQPLQTSREARVHTLAEYTNPIGRHAAEREFGKHVPDARAFYSDLEASLGRMKTDRFTDNLDVLIQRVKDRQARTGTALMDHDGSDPMGEQKVRGNIDATIYKAANFICPPYFKEPSDEMLLLQIDAPNNRATSVVKQEIEAILGARPDGTETKGTLISDDEGRLIDTYTTQTAFPGVDLVYQYMEADHIKGQAARVRVWLNRPGRGTGTSADKSPKANRAHDANKSKHRLSLPRFMRRHKNKNPDGPAA